MYQTSVASREELAEILAFLEERRLKNAWLIWFVWDTLHDPDYPGEVLACRSGSRVADVAYIGHRPAQSEGAPPRFDVHMDAASVGATRALGDALPPGSVGRFELFTPQTQGYFNRLEDAERHDDDLCFGVTAEQIRPVDTEDMVELLRVDAGLFDGCERQPPWEHAGEESRFFPIVVDGRPAASIWRNSITPRGTTTPRVVSIGRRYTETRCRRRGLARRLVSHLTRMVLTEGYLPIYYTEPGNVASQALCRSLGYR